MTIPEEAIIATLDDGTLVCWLHKLPAHTKYYLAANHPDEVFNTHTVDVSGFKQIAVFVAPPTYTIELTEAEAVWLLASTAYYSDSRLATTVHAKVVAAKGGTDGEGTPLVPEGFTVDRQGDAGGPCESCGTAFDICTEGIFSGKGRACCSRCTSTRTHGQTLDGRFKDVEKVVSSDRKTSHDPKVWAADNHLVTVDEGGRPKSFTACSQWVQQRREAPLSEVTCGNCTRTKAYKRIVKGAGK